MNNGETAAGRAAAGNPARRRRDPRATRRAIVQAARDLIMAKGFASASISEIAKRAGVTKSLIHHHYGSKQSLFHEVIRLHLAENEERIRSYMENVEVDDRYIAAGMAAYFRFQTDTPDYTRMGWRMNQLFERNEQGSPLPPQSDDDEGMSYFHQLAGTAVEQFAKLRDEGKLRADLDPAMVLVAIFCLTEHWHEAKQRMLMRLGIAGVGEDLDRKFLDNAIEILLHGVLPRAR